MTKHVSDMTLTAAINSDILAPLSRRDEVRHDEKEKLEDLDNVVTRVQTGNPVTLQETRTHSGENAAPTTLVVVTSEIDGDCGCFGKNCFNPTSTDIILGYMSHLAGSSLSCILQVNWMCCLTSPSSSFPLLFLFFSSSFPLLFLNFSLTIMFPLAARST